MPMIKKAFITVAMAAVLSPAAPAAASEADGNDAAILPVAYAALRDGKPQDAVAQLAPSSRLAARDPSRLINLGTAYARLGRSDEAEAMYRAAADSPIRYDLELADGRYMDSRWAARIALAGLQTKPRVTVELADAR
jgi:Tfp pilus assembly protein PilF